MALLGLRLQTPGGVVSIVEVEAYAGADDPGSHAYRGRTPRNEVLFGPPGRAYLYLNYCIQWLLNISARPEGEPSAILFRAVRHYEEEWPAATLAGPGKLTARLGVLPEFNRCDLLDAASPLHLLPGNDCPEVLVSTRVGLAPGKGDDLPWRFIAAPDVRYASRPQASVLAIRERRFDFQAD